MRRPRLERIQRIVLLRAENPDLSLEEIADEVGVSVDDARKSLRHNVPAVNDLADWEYEGPSYDDDDDDDDFGTAEVVL